MFIANLLSWQAITRRLTGVSAHATVRELLVGPSQSA